MQDGYVICGRALSKRYIAKIKDFDPLNNTSTQPFIIAMMDTYSGNSGGTVFNKKGNGIEVISGMHKMPRHGYYHTHITYVISAKDICKNILGIICID